MLSIALELVDIIGVSAPISLPSLERSPTLAMYALAVEAQRGKSWSAAKHADQSVRTGVLRRTSYTTYTLTSVPDLQGLLVAKTIRKR